MSKTKKARLDKRQTKPDIGIAKIDAPMSDGSVKSFEMKEAVRDALNKMPHPSDRRKARQEEIPVDASKYTTEELERNRYSGYRLNALKGTFEIWVLGRVAISERASRVQRNPALIADMHERAFATTGSIVEVEIPTYDKDPEAPAESAQKKH